MDAWHERKGVCQDFAHLELVLLRGMTIPSRYVSGYLRTKEDGTLRETVSGESHAIPVGSRRIWAALGRDHADVPPLKGISGGAATALEDTVDTHDLRRQDCFHPNERLHWTDCNP